MKRDKILVVEDDDNLRLTLVDNLQLEGYEVYCAATLEVANQAIKSQSEPFALIVLDIMLPDGSGYDFCQTIRSECLNTRVLMLTARTLNSDLLAGFSAGADDYMTKPYRLDELLARIKALISRLDSSTSPTNVSHINGYKVDWVQRSIISLDESNKDIHLTKKEFDILQTLFLNLNLPLSREKILHEVWGEKVCVEERTVDNFVSNIRKQLNLISPGLFVIKTIRGVGYSLTKQE